MSICVCVRIVRARAGGVRVDGPRVRACARACVPSDITMGELFCYPPLSGGTTMHKRIFFFSVSQFSIARWDVMNPSAHVADVGIAGTKTVTVIARAHR